jgi:hypothetical protein
MAGAYRIVSRRSSDGAHLPGSCKLGFELLDVMKQPMGDQLEKIMIALA